MTEDRPLLETVLAMTAASVERANLVDRELMLVRLAALATVDAPASSYLLNLGAAVDVGLTVEDVQGVLIAIAPIVGSPKVLRRQAPSPRRWGSRWPSTTPSPRTAPTTTADNRSGNNNGIGSVHVLARRWVKASGRRGRQGRAR